MKLEEIKFKREEWHLPYIGGLIDGEGYIGCTLSSKYKNYTPVLSVSMTDQKALELISNTFGGQIRLEQDFINKNWKDQFGWRYNGRRAVEIIKCIYPYLMVKKLQAKELLKIEWNTQSSRSLPDSERKLREEIYWNLRILNTRGKMS